MNQAEMVEEYAQVENDEFINIFCTPVQDQGETSSRHVDSSNMHTFYQHHPSEHRWTKDHPLEQVIGNPSQSVRTIRQLESDGEMCMFALTGSVRFSALTLHIEEKSSMTSVPPAVEVATVSVPTSSGLVPTASPIFTTASVVTPYSRRKGKEKMVELDTPKKKKLKEQIDVQEYEQFAADLSIREKIDMINKLVKYQDHYAKHFKGMTLEEIREKFIPVWKQIKDFVPMASKEEGERVKRKGLRLEQESAKKIMTSEEVSKEDLKEMTQLEIIRLGGHTAVYQFFVDMLKYFDREELTQLWTLVKETFSIRQAIRDKEKELWVELKRLYEPDVKDHLWTHTQALMHDPVEWRLYDTCGVHHVLTSDQEIFMLVKKDYPLRKGLAIVMISNKLQVENYSQMASDLIQKIHKIANTPRQRND
nr:hypothetical protein [Tanacetum cinerariifolium]